MLTAIVAILIFSGLVTVHEFGHFALAKMCKMYVQEFSIGMGPLICSKQWGETMYSFRAIPVGGFVRVLGEDVVEEENKDIPKIDVPEERRYQNRPVWQRMLFAAAGPAMNFVTAIVIFAVMFWVLGVAVPIENPDTSISSVVADSPAQEAGIEAGDKIVAVEGTKVDNWKDMTALISGSEKEVLDVVISHEGEERTVQIEPMISEEGKKVLGIYANSAERREVGVVEGITLGCKTTGEMVVMMGQVLGDLFTGQIDIMDEEEGLTGPVGIVKIIDQSTKAGWVYVANLAALLSVNLAVINLLPIPSLDGSKLVFLLIEGIRGKAIDPMKEGYINFVGFALMMLLVVVVTFKDVMNLF